MSLPDEPPDPGVPSDTGQNSEPNELNMEQVLNEVNTLELDSLDDDWVEAIYHSEFLEIADFPAEYEDAMESININKKFHTIMKSIEFWLESESDMEEENSWAVLSPKVKHKHLLTVLAYYINYGTKNVHTKEHRNNAILASRVYYSLLSIPGYKAYHIYHAQLFAHSLACLSFPQGMCEKDDHYFNTKELSREVNSMLKELRSYVLELRSIVEKLQLKPTDMNFEDILSNLVDITGGAIVNKLSIDKIELANISRVIYLMIDTLLQEPSGEPNAVAIRLLFKCLLPKLLAASLDSKNANNLVRASYVTYSGLLLSRYGKAAVSGFCVLLQHLCYAVDGLERAEVRTARVSLVVGLMSLLPRKSYRNYIKWLLKLTTTAKISHRQIALEILAKLLSNDPDDQIEQPEPEPGTSQPNQESTVQQAQNEPVASTSAEGQVENIADSDSQHTATTEDDTSQELPDIAKDDAEEEVSGLLRARAHRAPHGDVLRACTERAHDASSTLRARALCVLADCLVAPTPALHHAIKVLNGEGEIPRLVALAARCVSDERAAVRRAALHLMYKLMATDEDNITETNLGVVVSLCRDASIIVRSAAIGAIGDLVLQWGRVFIMDAFLSGPLHQLSDPETKVQEQVTTLIQQLLFERLCKFSPNSCDDLLPWTFLASITQHNMRRHLQKACTLLFKTAKCVNHRVVDILSCHLGALNDERDLHCLVMLTSVCKHVDYTELGFLLDYYYKLNEDLQCRDGRLLPLTVELLTSWSQWVSVASRAQLRAHLVTALGSNHAGDSCRTSCAALAAHLDPDNLQWATELMQIYERRALNGGSVEEWVSAADMSLVAPQPPSPELLRLFIAALDNPPPDCDAASRGCMVAGLGRLCIRSREVAVEAAPPLSRVLFSNNEPIAARVNSLLALTDICTRYTCIVEPLLSSVCACLGTESPAALRSAAAVALTRLLLGGYLRLRTPLYYKYCALLADEDHDVREPAEYYVTSCLTVDTIYHHFVECVLHYNKDDTETISFDARQLIYDVMLQRMSLVQKLNIQCRLAREVLEHAADMCDDCDDELTPGMNAALLDTITLLCGPRMKLPRRPQNTGEAADLDDLQERVTTNIVSHKMKSTVAEVLVPAVLRLYSRLRSKGGQLVVYLVRIATDLLKDYRQEIEELIENDEELVQHVRMFQENIGEEPSFGNSRNLVTASTEHEPETPRSTRRRPHNATRTRGPPAKRALRI